MLAAWSAVGAPAHTNGVDPNAPTASVFGYASIQLTWTPPATVLVDNVVVYAATMANGVFAPVGNGTCVTPTVRPCIADQLNAGAAAHRSGGKLHRPVAGIRGHVRPDPVRVMRVVAVGLARATSPA